MSEMQKITEENYCLAYELETMADLLIRKEGERWVPGFCDEIVEIEHLARYRWVSQQVKGMNVLDIACGSGHGSFLMAAEGQAESVIGCDISAKAVKYASIKNRHSRVIFVEGNAETFQLDRKLDVVVSFETIEHIPNAEIFLDNVCSLLSDGGHFFVSTPISGVSIDTRPANPYHLREWGFHEFQNMVGKYLEIENIYVQLSLKSRTVKFNGLNWAIRRIQKAYDSLIYDRKPYVSALRVNSPMAVVEWQNAIFPADLMGNTLEGYQILRCRKYKVQDV